MAGNQCNALFVVASKLSLAGFDALLSSYLLLLLLFLSPYFLIGLAATESCIGNPKWGSCSTGNIGFRHPTQDTIKAYPLDENADRLVMDGNLHDWADHPVDLTYTDVEFAVLNGTVVKFEEPFSNGTYNGPSDFSYTLKLKWDPTWLYVAVEVTDDLWEDVIESNGCYEHGLQLAIEVGGENATRADGKSELGLVQARRSDNLGQSRMVMINVAMSAGVTSCACVDCDTSSNAPANDQCCVTYENHGAPSPTAGTSFLQRLSLGIVRDEVAGKTFYEVAIHRGDIMYEDWPGRELSSASRWSAGTVMGFSMVANEGAEESPEGPPTQHSWGGYYPHAIVFGWNGGEKEPQKLGTLELFGENSATSTAGVCFGLPMETLPAEGVDGDVRFQFDLTEQLLGATGDAVAVSDNSLVGRITTSPRFGRLALKDTTLASSVAEVKSRYVWTVAPTHTYGPSFSSHDSNCGDCCYTPGHNAVAIKTQTPACNQECTTCTRSVFMMEGPPDSGGSDLERAWVPGCTACGLQWAVVEFEYPMYATEIRITEAGRRGSVTRLDVATDFKGDNTQWGTVWERGPGYNAAEEVDDSGLVVITLCSNTNWVKFVRVWVDTDGADELVGLDAVELLGHEETPNDYLRFIDREVVVEYAPLPGLHVSSTAGESFSFARLQTTCESATSASPAASGGSVEDNELTTISQTIGIRSTRPESSAQGTLWSNTTVVALQPFRRETATIDVGAVLANISAIVGNASSDDAAVTVTQVRFSHPANADGSNHNSFYQAGSNEEIPSDAELVEVEPSETGQYALDMILRLPEDRIRVWIVTSVGVTYRVGITLASLCPDGTPVADYEAEKCLATQKSAGAKTAVVAGISASLGLVALLAVVVAYRLFSRNKRLAAELEKLEGMSRLRDDSLVVDTDSPISKVLDFLQKLNREKVSMVDIVRISQEMQQLLLSSQQLFEPDLNKELEGKYDSETRNFILTNMSTAAPVADASTRGFRLAGAKQQDSTITRFSTGVTEWPAQLIARCGIGSETLRTLSRVGQVYAIDPFEVMSATNGRGITAVVVHYIYTSPIPNCIPLELQPLLNWLTLLDDAYATQTPAYHCATHVLDVTMNMAAVMNGMGLNVKRSGGGYFSTMDEVTGALHLLAGIVAAAIHDLGHDGFNNAYHVATISHVSRMFNNQSVLEHFSLRTALETMLDPENDFLRHAPQELKAMFRGLVIDIVLATDMKHHFELINTFKIKVLEKSGVKDGGPPQQLTEPQQAVLALQLGMKVCDLGHSTADTGTHIRWCALLEEEFFTQGDLERERGLPVSPLMDRTKTGVLTPGQAVGFFDFIVLPLYETFTTVFPDTKMMLTNARRNHKTWKALDRAGLPASEWRNIGKGQLQSQVDDNPAHADMVIKLPSSVMGEEEDTGLIRVVSGLK